MTQKAFLKRIPALRGVPVGPPRALYDANQIAKVWVKDGYVVANARFDRLIVELDLTRVETIMLSSLITSQKLKIEGFV